MSLITKPRVTRLSLLIGTPLVVGGLLVAGIAGASAHKGLRQHSLGQAVLNLGPEAGLGSVPMTAENGFVGKLPDGRTVSIVEVLASDQNGTLHAFTPSGKPESSPAVQMNGSWSPHRSFDYIVLARTTGDPSTASEAVGPMKELGPEDPRGGQVLFEGVMGIRMTQSRGEDKGAVGETGFAIEHHGPSPAIAPEATLIYRNPKFSQVATIDLTQKSVDSGDFEGKIVIDPKPETLSGGQIALVNGGDQWRKILLTGFDPKLGGIEMTGHCSDGDTVHIRPAMPFSSPAARSALFHFPQEWGVTKIEVRRYPWETIKVSGVKLVSPSAQP